MESTQAGEAASSTGPQMNPVSDPDACLHQGDNFLEPQLTVRIRLVKTDAVPNKPYL